MTDLLAQLVARSLVVADTNDAGARYRLLETTRVYALEKLAEAGETDAIKRLHAEHFRDRFERAYDDWLRMSDSDWHALYFPERDNVRVALDWALGVDGDPIIGIALAGASAALWAELSLPVEGRQRIEAAIAQVNSHTSKSDQARLWLWLGLHLRFSAPTLAAADLERAIDLTAGCKKRRDSATRWTRLGDTAGAVGPVRAVRARSGGSISSAGTLRAAQGARHLFLGLGFN